MPARKVFMHNLSELSSSRLLNNVIKLICAAAIISAGYIGIQFFRADLPELVIFLCFILFYVLIPGMFILRLSGMTSSYASVNLSRAFFIGFAFIVGLYFISDFISSDILLMVVGPVLSLFYIVKSIRSGSDPLTKIHSVISSVPASLLVFTALVFAYSMLTTQYTYIPPTDAAFSNINLDFGFHAGIVNALAEDFPPQNPWISGRIISYHLFTELLYSIPVRIFGLESEEIILCCTPYIIAPLLSCSLYGFFREFMADQKRCGLYCISLVASNMFILKSRNASWFLYHLISNKNNAGMGVAAVLVIITLLKYLDDGAAREKKKTASFLILLSALIMLTTGIKGPAALVLVGGMAGTVLLGLILRKTQPGWISATLVSVISFGFIYFYILGSEGSGQTNGKGGSVLNPWEVTDLFFLKEEVLELVSRPLALPLLLVVFMLFTLTAFSIPFIIGYLRELYLVISGKKDYVFSRVVIYASCMVGFIALMLFNFSGHSQVYFGFVSLGLVPAVSFWYLEDFRGTKALVPKLISAVFILCICLTSVSLFMKYYDYASASNRFYESRNSSHNKYREISSTEYEAMMWLKENTDEEAIIASDRYYSVPLEEYDYSNRSHNYHFVYAIYSQREQYLEGSGFSLGSDEIDLRKEMIDNVNKMTDPGNESRDELARSLDVDYVLISKRFNDVGDLSSEDYTLVFSNEDVDIYKVEDAA